MVDILFQSGRAGRVAASFQAKENGISGMIATNDEETRRLFAEHLGSMVSAMQGGEDSSEAVDINVAYVPDLSLEHYEMASLQREAKMQENGTLAERGSEHNPVQTARLYHIAESFIQSIQELL